MSDLTVSQSYKAVNYSIIFLKNEIESINITLKQSSLSNVSRKLLRNRLRELESDLIEFEQLDF